MSTTTERAPHALALLLAVLMSGPATAQAQGAGGAGSTAFDLGRPATSADLARFYSSMPDGRDLPKGSGSVAQGKAIYEAQCSACHGDNLQGGIGDRLIGGRGTLAQAASPKPPVKTVESYWPYATTLFDYIKRAMPLTAPESLSDDQVYALCAYILSRADIVAADATLDARTLAAVRMPNRSGFTRDPRPESFPPPAQTPHEHKEIATEAR